MSEWSEFRDDRRTFPPGELEKVNRKKKKKREKEEKDL